MDAFSRQNTIARPRQTARGLAFEIAEHLLISSWAAFHDIPISMHLDHGQGVEEFEEALILTLGTEQSRRVILWRNATAVFIQPLFGKTQQFRSVTQALGSLTGHEIVALTSITPTEWPKE
jgi:hypothetical protein